MLNRNRHLLLLSVLILLPACGAASFTGKSKSNKGSKNQTPTTDQPVIITDPPVYTPPVDPVKPTPPTCIDPTTVQAQNVPKENLCTDDDYPSQNPSQNPGQNPSQH